MVSNEELIIDIENTKKEAKAFKQIAEGFMIISSLPENEDISRLRWLMKVREYTICYSESFTLLSELVKIARKRGLTIQENVVK